MEKNIRSIWPGLKHFTIIVPVRVSFITEGLRQIGFLDNHDFDSDNKNLMKNFPVLASKRIKILHYNPEQTVFVDSLLSIDWKETDSRPGLELT